MKEELELHCRPADSISLPETLLSRLNKLEEELEGFNKDQFVRVVLEDKLDDLEQSKGKVLSWSIEPIYHDDSGLKTS